MSASSPAPEVKTCLSEFRQEFASCWERLPWKGVFFGLLGAWLLLFHFLGNSTLGYVETSSLFGWLHYAYESSVDDQHGYLIPLVVLGLMWWKREALLAVEKRPWWPALLLLLLALLLHAAGYVVQQTRVSVAAFFLGVYALMGLVWGPRWLQASFFPFFLFAFCIPIATLSEPITFPLRLFATKITDFVSRGVLGIHVICDGTRIFDPNGSYKYEVAAACSGIRSLTATFALSVIYAFVALSGIWKRLLLVAAAFPLAVLANVLRLSMIIVAAEAFGGQSAGNYVHENAVLSMIPYLPALGGIFFLGHWLRDDRRDRGREAGTGLAGSHQEA
jgi:exosortase